jgi:C4-dicarboxylate transporter/malic acid transport protein
VDKNNLNTLIRHFSPTWYASVMGTGGFANVLYLLSANFIFLKIIAQSLFFLNLCLFLVLIIPWTLRWFLHFDKLIEDLSHPIMSNFFPTMPVGGLVLGTNFFLIGKDFFSHESIIFIGNILWLNGVILCLIFAVLVTYNMVVKEKIEPEFINFSWYIPPVATIVVPLLGNMVARSNINTNIDYARAVNFTDIIFFGIGLALFVTLNSILLNRFIAHKLPGSIATPTFWIILGPIGVGTVSLLGIADVSASLKIIEPAGLGTINFMSAIFWSFGVWAFLLVVLITLKYLKSERAIPFTLSWWAFIFPLAAYTLSSFSIYQYCKVEYVYWYTVLLATLLAFLWILTFVSSIYGTFSGKYLFPKQIKQVNVAMTNKALK